MMMGFSSSCCYQVAKAVTEAVQKHVVTPLSLYGNRFDPPKFSAALAASAESAAAGGEEVDTHGAVKLRCDVHLYHQPKGSIVVDVFAYKGDGEAVFFVRAVAGQGRRSLIMPEKVAWFFREGNREKERFIAEMRKAELAEVRAGGVNALFCTHLANMAAVKEGEMDDDQTRNVHAVAVYELVMYYIFCEIVATVGLPRALTYFSEHERGQQTFREFVEEIVNVLDIGRRRLVMEDGVSLKVKDVTVDLVDFDDGFGTYINADALVVENDGTVVMNANFSFSLAGGALVTIYAPEGEA